MMFEVQFSRDSAKFLKRTQKPLIDRLLQAIRELQQDPFPREAIKIKGEENVFRIRVGAHRILYEVYPDRQLVLVVDIDKRGRVYG